MAGMFDAAVDDIAAGEDKAARAAQPGSTLTPPPATPPVTQSPTDVLPGLPANDAAPAPASPLVAPAAPAPTSSPLDPPAPAGLFDGAVTEIATEDASRLQGALDVARKTDPVRYTEASRIAARDGLPMEFVTQNLDDLKSQATANDMRKSLEASPKLKNWFLTGDNANTVKLDDLHKLSGLGWLYEATAANWQEGWDQRQSADIRYRQIFGTATPAEIARADAADRQDKRDYGIEGFFQGAVPGLAQQLPNMIGGMAEGATRIGYAATLGTAAGAAVGSLAGGVGAVPGAVAGFGSGVAAGMIQGRTIDSFRQEAGGAYSEFLQVRGDSGERIDPGVAKGAALIAGSANAALETIGEAALERLVPGLDKFGVGALLRNGSREVLKEAIRRPSIQAALKSFGGNVLRGGATEVGTEVLQEAVTIMARIAAEKNSAGEFQPMEAGEIATRLVDTAEQTAQAMLILTPALASTRLGRDLSTWKRSEDMRSVYEQANTDAATTELRTRAPEKYLDAVKSFLSDGKASDTVYVLTDKLTELFQSMDLSPADLDARIDGFSARYAEALATGNDTHIDMAAYQTHIAGTPLGEALIEHQRWHPEMTTVAEARDALADARSSQDSMLEEALAASKADAARAAPRQQVEEAVYGMLVNIGESPDTARAQAKLQAAFFDTMGQRAGIDPLELFNAQNLDVRRAMPDGLDYRKVDELDLAIDAVRRGDGDRAARLRKRGQGQSLGGFLASKGGLRETESFAGELKARDLKKMNGGRLLAREGREGGFDLDTASLAAAEAGYFPDVMNDDGSINREGLVERLLAAVDEEVAGRPLFAIHADDVAIDPQLARVEALSNEMAELGLNPAAMTNEEIRAELMKATSPNATEGALFQFAGERAVRREPAGSEAKVGLARAEQMEFAGSYPDEIYDETGFFKGIDGKWRIELDDSEARLDGGAFQISRDGGEDYRGRLDGVFSHPGLFAAYPELRSLYVEIGIGSEHDGGVYNASDLAIRVDARDEKRARSTLLHEVTHAIQHIEGFAFGGNTGMGEIYEGEIVRDLLSKAEKNKADQLAVARAFDSGANKDRAVDIMGKLLTQKEQIQAKLKQAAGYEYYRRIAGEVEARNVQARDKGRLSGEELDSPRWTEDVQRGDQIIVAISPRKGVAFEAMSSEQEPEVREFFQGNDKQDLAGKRADKRGSIQFQGDRTVINLFQAANLSTFLHESGHLFLEVSKQVAEGGSQEPGANDAIRDDWRKVLEFIGAEEGKPIPREAHEKFAKAFETYLSEGKAPSDELRGVFERFKSWMLHVYRGMARAIGLPAIPADIRAVFDRMLATDEELAEIARGPEVRPMFSTAAEAGLDDAQWARMVKAAEAATDAAKGELLARMLGESRRGQTREWKAEKTAVRQEVTDEYLTRPVYQVQNFIATGAVPDDMAGAISDIGDRRLDRAWLVSRFGADVLRRLPKVSGRLLYVEKGGLNPDEAAELFGFNSGEHMVGELMSAPPLNRAIVARTDELMRERHGDMLSNQAAAAEAATQAFHNDERGPFLELELLALASKAKIKAGKILPQKIGRQMARDLIRGKKAAEAGRVSVFARARDKAARAAEKAMLQEEWAKAAEFKRQQIFNHYLTLEATAARDEAESIRRYLDKFSDRKRPGGVDPDYLDQIEGILERFEFKKATSLPAIERRKSLAAFVAEAEARGDALLIPPDLLEKAALTSYKDMTMEDLSALRDVVKNVEHLGRLKNRLLEKGRLVAFTAARDELVAQTVRTPPKKAQKYRNPTGWERFANGVAGVDAYLLKMEQVFQWLDFGDVNGPFTRVIFQKFVDAQNRKSEMQLAVSAKLKAILDGLDAGYLNERKAVPLRPELSFTRAEIYAIALNQGTESNRSKILKGETSAKNSFRSEDEMNSALSVLTKEDWDRVQSMWDVLEGFWPETAALERRLTGVEPPKLERRKVATAFGEYAGGYYPMVYDPAQAFDVQQRSDKELDSAFDNSTFSRPAVAHGFTKARADNYSRPILLDLRALTGHIDKAIQNITHREPVRDTLKLISDPDLQRTLIETMGRPVYQEMWKWLDRIAKDRGEPPANASIARMMSGARANISLYAMGFRLTTALSQLAGWSNAMELVKPSHMGAALAATIRHPQETWETITAKSGEMRDRTNNLDRDVRAALARLEGKTGAVDAFKRFAFWGTAMADRAVAAPTWLGGYNQHLATYPTDEAGAIRAGDRAVRLTQGSGAAKDLSSIMGNKNEALQVYTMFYSYFNLYYNRLRTLGRDTRTMLADGEYEDIPHLLARSVFLVIVPAIMADALVGKWKDDDEGWAWWAFRKASLYPLMSVPLLRDIGGALDSGLAYQMSPLARFGELATKLVQDANKVAHGEDVESRLIAKRAAELAGYTFGLPLGQGVGTASNVWQGLAEGDFKTRDLLFSRRAFGDTRDK